MEMKNEERASAEPKRTVNEEGLRQNRSARKMKNEIKR